MIEGEMVADGDEIEFTISFVGSVGEAVPSETFVIARSGVD